jgi:hypothetical protein
LRESARAARERTLERWERSGTEPAEGANGRQSKLLDSESSGITSESNALLSECSGI